MKRDIKNIFLPFLNGILTYDCRQCGFICCLRYDMRIDISEKDALIRDYPYLKYFLSEESESKKLLNRFTRCWFLDGEGLCLLQKKKGYGSKPFICRLYPFYIYKCDDGYIVLPQEDCFLRVGKGKKDTSYEQLLKNGRKAIKNNFIFGEVNLSRNRLNFEKKVLKASKMFLGRSNYLDFLAFQMSIASKGKNADLKKNKSKLNESLNIWESFLEVDKLNVENKGLTYELTALTSLLRVGSPVLRKMELEKIPLALLAVYFYALLFAENKGMRNSLQTFMQILHTKCLGLLFIKKEDLRLNISFEGKVNYLQKLHRLYIQRKLTTNKRPTRIKHL